MIVSLISKLLGFGFSEPVNAIGNVFDKLFTSDKEKKESEAVLEKIKQNPQILQMELNKVETRDRSIFMAGWRPCFGWICCGVVAYSYLILPIIGLITGKHLATTENTLIIDMFGGLLGLGFGGIRTFEKLKGLTK